MPGEVRVAGADLSDARVRRLVEPTALHALTHGSSVARAVWVNGVPVACAAARIDDSRCELLSLACLTDARPTPALGWAIQDLRKTVGGALVYEPWAPPAPHVAQALTAAGMSATGPQWCWYEFDPTVVAQELPTVTRTLPASTLEDIGVSEYRQHPDDLPALSPVLVDEGPVAYAVLRQAAGAYMLQWAWVDPRRRGEGLIVQLCAALFDRIDAPVRFRVHSSNAEVNRALQTAPDRVVRELHRVRTWVG